MDDRRIEVNGKRIAIDADGDPWDEIEPGLFKARCGAGHQCDVPGECQGDELLLVELAHGYGLHSLGSAPSPANREALAALFRAAPGQERLGDQTPGEIADALIARYDIRERGEQR